MKNLISINSKFMILEPKELVKMILKFKYTEGVEVFINYDSNFEKKYLENLVIELKRNNLVLQVHGDINLEYKKQLNYIKQLEKYSDYLEYPIVLTLHSIYNEDKNESLNKTIEYIEYLINNTNNNILFSLENLNDLEDKFRLGKEDISSAILNIDKLFFTYDIGHEIANHGNVIDLSELLVRKIRNVHIHSNNDKGNDHIPIYKNDRYWNEITKGISYLIKKKYQYNIVYEYGLDYCRGKTNEDKIIDYLKSIDYVSKKYMYE